MRSLETAQNNTSPTYIHAESYGVLSVSGHDAATFLQGQLTCDVQALAPKGDNTWLRGGHCDAKGKLWSTFFITSADNTSADSRSDNNEPHFLLIMPKATLPATLKELQKFGVFHKVEFKDISDSVHVIAVAGKNALSASKELSLQLTGPLVIEESIVLAVADTLPEKTSPGKDWTLISIANVWPELAADQVQQFVPQMLNLDLLHGINFKKGCYIGQETVARMHYKGQVKKRTYCVTGTAASLPEPGEQLEKQIGENWRRAGEILQSVWYDDGVVALLAVMSADTESETRLRIKGQDDSQFTLCPDS